MLKETNMKIKEQLRPLSMYPFISHDGSPDQLLNVNDGELYVNISFLSATGRKIYPLLLLDENMRHKREVDKLYFLDRFGSTLTAAKK